MRAIRRELERRVLAACRDVGVLEVGVGLQREVLEELLGDAGLGAGQVARVPLPQYTQMRAPVATSLATLTVGSLRAQAGSVGCPTSLRN
jgi:hypothetical protein